MRMCVFSGFLFCWTPDGSVYNSAGKLHLLALSTNACFWPNEIELISFYDCAGRVSGQKWWWWVRKRKLEDMMVLVYPGAAFICASWIILIGFPIGFPNMIFVKILFRPVCAESDPFWLVISAFQNRFPPLNFTPFPHAISSLLTSIGP